MNSTLSLTNIDRRYRERERIQSKHELIKSEETRQISSDHHTAGLFFSLRWYPPDNNNNNNNKHVDYTTERREKVPFSLVD